MARLQIWAVSHQREQEKRMKMDFITDIHPLFFKNTSYVLFLMLSW